MLSQHKEAFYYVANELWCWICLREPNPLSDQWIGKFGFVPKSLACKAKTSDNPDFRFKGLVVDPVLCPEAFIKKEDAIDTWKHKFLHNGRLPDGFTREKDGFEKGVLKYNGSKIHADFDLMLLLKAEKNGERATTTNEEENKMFPLVQKLLNEKLGSKMIQHGTEFQYLEGVGARESEFVYFFGPKRQFLSSISSMPVKPGTTH